MKKKFHTGRVILLAVLIFAGCRNTKVVPNPDKSIWTDFLITRNDLILNVNHAPGKRELSFADFKGTPREWKEAVTKKFSELIGFTNPEPGEVKKIREIEFEGVRIQSFIMTLSDQLSIHAYLLEPADEQPGGQRHVKLPRLLGGTFAGSPMVAT